MCGIVGLFHKNKTLQTELGMHLSRMLCVMSDRGPDSAGFAVYQEADEGLVKITVRDKQAPGKAARPFKQIIEVLGRKPAIKQVFVRDDHAVLLLAESEAETLIAELSEHSECDLVASGRSIELYKSTGRPQSVTARFELSSMPGMHGIGHTRMATESKVTLAGSHPFLSLIHI